jgi:hypothetical protein
VSGRIIFYIYQIVSETTMVFTRLKSIKEMRTMNIFKSGNSILQIRVRDNREGIEDKIVWNMSDVKYFQVKGQDMNQLLKDH